MSAGLPNWLFVSYGGGHVKALLPVAQRVRDLGLAHPVYLALTTAADVVRDAGIDVVGFNDFIEPGDEAALLKGEELVAQLQVQAAERDESIAYLGLSYIDMEQRLGVEEAARQYRQYGRQAFLPQGILERVIRKLSPQLVVATNSPRAEQAAIQAAGQLRIPCACLVDLLGIWERDLIARPDYADALCVLNDSVAQGIVRAGRPATQVHATGNPAFDSLHDTTITDAGAAIRREAGWQGLHVCLYASSPEPVGIPGVVGTGDPQFPRRIEIALVGAVQANPGLALFVRRHPSEAPADEVRALAHPRIRVSERGMPLHAAIHASDEVIVTVSTVGVEANMAGKAVTQVRGSILDHLSPYLELGIAQRQVELADVASAYAAGAPVLHPTRARRANAALADATSRVVEVLTSLVGSRRG